MLKIFVEHPFGAVMAILVFVLLCYVAMAIGFQMMVGAIKILTWLVVKLDAFARWHP